MTNHIQVRNYFLFEKGFSEKHHSLFDIYNKNDQDFLNRKFQDAKESLSHYEETMMYPVITGPGFCGATNPGAGKSFNGIMTDSHTSLYNSDCLYINPNLNIFAVSDPPGATNLSRTLFQELDTRLKKESADRIEILVNDLASCFGADEHATLALIHFPKNGTDEKYNKATVFIAGDTVVYHGNLNKNQIVRLNGAPHFWGTSNHYIEPEIIHLADGDFFIIASDGIDALGQIVPDKKIEDVLLTYVEKDPEAFALNLIKTCTGIFKKKINQRTITFLGGNDDITTVLVFPENLSDTNSDGGYVLGGYRNSP